MKTKRNTLALFALFIVLALSACGPKATASTPRVEKVAVEAPVAEAPAPAVETSSSGGVGKPLLSTTRVSNNATSTCQKPTVEAQKVYDNEATRFVTYTLSLENVGECFNIEVTNGYVAEMTTGHNYYYVPTDVDEGVAGNYDVESGGADLGAIFVTIGADDPVAAFGLTGEEEAAIEASADYYISHTTSLGCFQNAHSCRPSVTSRVTPTEPWSQTLAVTINGDNASVEGLGCHNMAVSVAADVATVTWEGKCVNFNLTVGSDTPFPAEIPTTVIATPSATGWPSP